MLDAAQVYMAPNTCTLEESNEHTALTKLSSEFTCFLSNEMGTDICLYGIK